MKIYVYDSEILREKSTNVENFDQELKDTLDEMVKTMRAAKGIGLAANQVGINKRFFVLEIDGNVYKIVNPEIVEFGEEKFEFEEGCLSIPGVYRKVIRPKEIKVRYNDENGTLHEADLDEMMARAFQHEYDHLDGVLFIDRITPLSKNLIKKKLENLKKNNKPREF
ncbi:peptide deformylase [Pseudostreptobacillus hongkongensis]|uniref:peptide deformylase n=1 Tax=Pseudostreptobacillus hongkongensis TaxID=1162717 RepID=UPI0008301F13|nr:peptide deformylase [Pseudostreptobacillus hongkongensis]